MIDVLSHYADWSLGTKAFSGKMDETGVALIAFSPEIDEDRLEPYSYPDLSASLHDLIAEGPGHFMPVPTADLHRVVQRHEDPAIFLDRLFADVLRERYPMMGEFLFQAYPTNLGWVRQRLAGRLDSAAIPVDGPLGERVFRFSEEHGLPFLLHYEPEDESLRALETMLKRHPKAKVVWRQVGQARYRTQSRSYGPAYVRKLLETYPHLYFDFSWTDIDEFYIPSREFSSLLWDRRARVLDAEWARLIADHPWRFMVGLGLRPDAIHLLPREVKSRRGLLSQLPPEIREIIAYRAAWKLIFGGDLP